MSLKAAITVFFALVSSPAFAFLSLNESGEITPPGIYKLGVEPQIRLSNGSGGNLGVFIDSAINDDWSWRAQMGTGDTDFWAAGSAKWVPIPDYQNQPAIGLRMEANIGREDNESFSVLRVAPLVSKGYDTDIGKITPYAALPIGLFASKGSSDSISQFVIGSEGRFEQTPDFLFSAEIGFNMSRTFSYLAGTATYFFRDTNTRKR